MKKILLSATLLAGAMSAGAQTQESCFFDTSIDLTDGVAVTANTVCGTSEHVTMMWAYDDTYKTTSISSGGFSTISVNGTSYELGTGYQGSANPGARNLLDGSGASGLSNAVTRFDVTADGYLTVIGKLSSNKPYYVWEGLAGEGEEPVAYTLAMAATYSGDPDQVMFGYTVPGDEMGYVDLEADDIFTYINEEKGCFYWPETIYLGTKADASSALMSASVGIITFPVYADAVSYLVHATGSKISCLGAVFTSDPVTSVILSGEETADVVLIGGTTGISSTVVSAVNADAPVYNLTGQRVSKETKGILIQNGKKFINK